MEWKPLEFALFLDRRAFGVPFRHRAVIEAHVIAEMLQREVSLRGLHAAMAISHHRLIWSDAELRIESEQVRIRLQRLVFRIGSNSPNVIRSVSAAMVTYCFPFTLKVTGEA